MENKMAAGAFGRARNYGWDINFPSLLRFYPTQSALVLQDGISSAMKDDIESFDYSWLLDLVLRMDWGEDVVNVLLVGMPNVVTPAHYDILENLFVQVGRPGK